jgi:uncharacterized protein (TIGR00369 family)
VNDEQSIQTLRERFAATPIYAALGLAIGHVAPGDVRLTLRCGPLHANIDGWMHGGVFEFMADTAMGLVARLAMPADAGNATLQLSMAFHSSIRMGDDVVCDARVARTSGRFVWTACDVRRVGESESAAGASALQMIRAGARRDLFEPR